MADYRLNMTPDFRPQKIAISQNDVGRAFTVELYDRAGAYAIPAGAEVSIAGTKPSGLGFTVVGTYDNKGVATFVVTEGMSDESGDIYCEVRIVNGQTRIGSANAWLCVEINPHPDDVTDDTAPHLIDTITALVIRAEDASDAAERDAGRAESAAERAESAVSEIHDLQASASTLPAGSSATASYDSDTGVLSFGIPKGDKGDRGDVNFATFEIDPETGILTVNYTTDDSDITFAINNAHMEVTIG